MKVCHSCHLFQLCNLTNLIWFSSRASHGIVTARSSCLQTNLDQYFVNFQKSIRDGELNEFLLLKESEVETTERKCVNFPYLDMLTLRRIYSTYFLKSIKNSCHHGGCSLLGSFIYYVRKISRKTKFFYRLVRTRSCAYQGVRNFSFSENFAYVINEWPLFK